MTLLPSPQLPQCLVHQGSKAVLSDIISEEIKQYPDPIRLQGNKSPWYLLCVKGPRMKKGMGLQERDSECCVTSRT